MYDFDELIDRKNTNSVKFDFAVEFGKPADVLPLWVADMDFRTAQPVLDQIHKMADHGIFGYSNTKDDYYQAVIGWFSEQFGWSPEREWFVRTPGVVFAIATAIRALTKAGDAVLVQPPVYYPFSRVILNNDRRVVTSPLVLQNGHYEIDFADFEQKITDHQVKMFILCSPHNPVGRVWTRDELAEIGRICKKHQVLVVSDEIHCDFVLPGYQHTVFLLACPDMEDLSIVCTAPSKTFNLAGLQTSNIFIPSAQLRERYQHELACCGYSELNAVGLAACQTAYAKGKEWQLACKQYLQENLAYLRTYLAKNLPQLKLIEPEGTYFAWVDFSALGMDHEALDQFILQKAHLWLDAGHIFGAEGDAYQRIVLACPRTRLEQALNQLKTAIDTL